MPQCELTAQMSEHKKVQCDRHRQPAAAVGTGRLQAEQELLNYQQAQPEMASDHWLVPVGFHPMSLFQSVQRRVQCSTL